MAYALRYQAQIMWVGPGAGPMAGMEALALPGTGGGTGQLKEFTVNPAVQPIVGGAGAGGALAAADITALLASMSSDLSAQMNAAIATMQGWPSGNP